MSMTNERATPAAISVPPPPSSPWASGQYAHLVGSPFEGNNATVLEVDADGGAAFVRIPALDDLEVLVLLADLARPQPGTIYPLGYLTPDSRARLSRMMTENAHLLLVDIRAVPRSRRPEWGQEALVRQWGRRYRFLGGALGNRNYAVKGAPIVLGDAERGGRQLRKWVVEQGYDALLTCACRDYFSCHRSVVVAEVVPRYLREAKVVLP